MPDPLPIIHPLLENPPRWTDDTKTKCGCNHCQHWYPLISHIKAQLNEEGKKLLEELVNDWGYTIDDLGVANAKLDGEWPGWEKMKDFKPNFAGTPDAIETVKALREKITKSEQLLKECADALESDVESEREATWVKIRAYFGRSI